MTQKKQFIIDGSRFSTLKTFYDEVGNVLCPDIGFKWNRSLDGFNDILFGGFGSFECEEAIYLTWKHSEKSRDDLGYDETVKCFKEWFWQCHHTNRSKIKDDMKMAKEGKGQTIFDILIKIIKENSHIDLILD